MGERTDVCLLIPLTRLDEALLFDHFLVSATTAMPSLAHL
jgi:hypothetical protein